MKNEAFRNRRNIKSLRLKENVTSMKGQDSVSRQQERSLGAERIVEHARSAQSQPRTSPLMDLGEDIGSLFFLSEW